MTDPTLLLNGDRVALPADATLAALLADPPGGPLPPRGVAVAVDGTVVPRAAWAGHRLHGGESVEVVTAVQGG